MYCTRDTTPLASMAYISNNSLFTLIFFINFALWDIFLPEDPFSAAYIGFDCYKLENCTLDKLLMFTVSNFKVARQDTHTSGLTPPPPFFN